MVEVPSGRCRSQQLRGLDDHVHRTSPLGAQCLTSLAKLWSDADHLRGGSADGAALLNEVPDAVRLVSQCAANGANTIGEIRGQLIRQDLQLDIGGSKALKNAVVKITAEAHALAGNC